MEREAVGERTREAIQHIRRSGYHFGKVPYGKRAVRAPDNPRMKVLVDDDAEQSVIVQFNAWAEAGVGVSEMASRLNAAAGIKPRQGQRWTKHDHNLRLRLSQIQQRAVNVRSHTDEDVKDRMLELRARGHTHAQVASILNELGFLPMKGRRFTGAEACASCSVVVAKRRCCRLADFWKRCWNACGASTTQQIRMCPLSDRDSRRWQRCLATRGM